MLDLFDVRSLRAFAALSDFERYFLTFIEGLEAVALDGAEMYKDIIAFICGDKTITLSCVEPLYCTVAFQCVASQQKIL